MKENKYKAVFPISIFLIVLTVVSINLRKERVLPEIANSQTASFDSISKEVFSPSVIFDLKKRNFIMPDGLIDNSSNISKNGKVKWKALTSYPSGCGAGQAVQKIGDKLSCINVLTASSAVNWLNLESYPSGCPAGQAIQAIGDTLTCVAVSGDSSVWTDGGDTTYLNSSTDSLAVGGTGPSAPFYFDNDNDRLQVESFRTGSATDNLSISSAGILTLSGSATVFEDLLVPVTSTVKGGSKDPGFATFKTNGSGSQGTFTYWFDSTSEEELYFTAQLPHGYKEGSNIQPHVHGYQSPMVRPAKKFPGDWNIIGPTGVMFSATRAFSMPILLRPTKRLSQTGNI